MRGMFKRVLSLLMSGLIVLSAYSPAFGETIQSKDYKGHWAEGVIASSIKSGLINGYTDGSFKPDQSITRAEFFALVNNAFDFTTNGQNMFNDVAADEWYAPVIAKAVAAGYIEGYVDGTIRPMNPITRQEAATILCRIKSLKAVSEELLYSDAAKIATWSKEAVIAILEAKIMTGYPDGSFKPEAQIKRAEALMAVSKCIDSATVYGQAGVYGPETGTMTIVGDVIIKAPGITLRNTIIKGDLSIAKEVGNGDVTLNQVTVDGNTYINGGGVNSIYFIDVTTGKVYVQKDDGPVRIVASGTTSINQVMATTNVKLEEVDVTGEGFEGIFVEKNVMGGIEITLVGVSCDSVEIQADGVVLTADRESSIKTLTVNAKNTEIKGTASIANAVVNQSGVTFETKPKSIVTAPGISEPVVSIPSSSAGNSGGDSGHSNPSINYASAPSRVQLSSNPEDFFNITNVAIPAPGGTDRTGRVAFPSFDDLSALHGLMTVGKLLVMVGPIPDDLIPNDKPIRIPGFVFSVTDTGAAISTIEIGGVPYTSGTIIPFTPSIEDYTVKFVVTTSETGKTTAVRNFEVLVEMPEPIDQSGYRVEMSKYQVGPDESFNLTIRSACDQEGNEVTGNRLVTVSSDDLSEGDAGVVYESQTNFVTGSAVIAVTLNQHTKQKLTVKVEGFDETKTVNMIVYSVENDVQYSLYDDTKVEVIGYEGTDANVVIPNTIEGKPVTSIGNNAFAENRDLVGVTLPPSIEMIGNAAFYGCMNLESIVIPDAVSVIETNTFVSCSSLESVIIGSGVHTIRSSAFNGCYSLKSITIPDNVTKIEDSAFTASQVNAMFFDGDAPTLGLNERPLGDDYNTVIYYYENAAGFTTPSWKGIATDIRVTGTPAATLNMTLNRPQLGNVTAEMEYSTDGGQVWDVCTADVTELDIEKLSALNDLKIRLTADHAAVQTIDILPGVVTPDFEVDLSGYYDSITSLTPHSFYLISTNRMSTLRFSSELGVIDKLQLEDTDTISIYRVGLHNERGPLNCLTLDTDIKPVQTIKIFSYENGLDSNDPISVTIGDTVSLGAVMNKDIEPVISSINVVNWSIANGTGEAIISRYGIVTPIKAGTVTVTATAADRSGVSVSIVITVTE